MRVKVCEAIERVRCTALSEGIKCRIVRLAALTTTCRILVTLHGAYSSSRIDVRINNVLLSNVEYAFDFVVVVFSEGEGGVGGEVFVLFILY